MACLKLDQPLQMFSVKGRADHALGRADNEHQMFGCEVESQSEIAHTPEAVRRGEVDRHTRRTSQFGWGRRFRELVCYQ
jgi:hypothetical protein